MRIKRILNLSEFVDYVNKEENQELFDRIFYKESDMPTHKFGGCSIL